MGSIVEGRNSVLEILRADVPVGVILVATGTKGVPIEEIRRIAASRGVEVRTVSRSVLDERSVRGAHQGVMAEVAPFEYSSLNDVLSNVGNRERSLIIALDHVADEGNLGAVARSAEAAGADALLLPKARAAGVGPTAYKTSAGALAYLPVILEPNLVRAVEKLKDAGYWVAGAIESGETVFWEAQLTGRLVLVVGSEGSGLSRLTERTCDFTVRLPLAGHVDSINVAQAATVLAFEWVRQGKADS